MIFSLANPLSLIQFLFQEQLSTLHWMMTTICTFRTTLDMLAHAHMMIVLLLSMFKTAISGTFSTHQCATCASLNRFVDSFPDSVDWKDLTNLGPECWKQVFGLFEFKLNAYLTGLPLVFGKLISFTYRLGWTSVPHQNILLI